jgi:hypothetical protein
MPRRPPQWTRPTDPPPPAGRWARWLALAVATLLALSALLLALLPGRPGPAAREPDPTGPDWGRRPALRPAPHSLAVGVTHTQYSIDDWDDADARAAATTVLAATATYQNQHIFGWGALNPEPRPGVFDWASLDRRMRLIGSAGGRPVITLCCAPDWMKGGPPGTSDWSRLHVAPSPQHYRDFAQLAVAVARRYPQVRHFLVWNEMKGFWNDRENRWDYEAYTRFYNTVYDALKQAVPGVAVGGPYVVVDVWADSAAGGRPSTLAGACGTVDRRSLDVLAYWLRYKHGADFVAVDGGSVSRDGGPVASTTVNSAVFGAITRWLRHHTSLPVWWSEFHVGQADSAGQAQLVATVVAGLLHMADEGAAAALVWQPQAMAGEDGVRPPALWTSTQAAGGGRPLALADALAWMQQVLADPQDGDPVSWPVPQVGVLHGRQELLAVNTGEHAAEVHVRGLRVRLGPYEVRHAFLPAGAPAAAPAWWTPTLDECLRDQPTPTP